ncbi:hypothetical protein [Dyadobacter sp. LHD-138]|uniref:hypothetical protein n=1 Tax=Dyadobacter sp. LHD-138 TaxID=3071413 RepID=UPI0027DFFAC3|nr:hypothetical protein [Dyadobacter sp. LHD-138]MDQ6482035.1 hypothetical protein [Dyadobacter sp. LHD-138]
MLRKILLSLGVIAIGVSGCTKSDDSGKGKISEKARPDSVEISAPTDPDPSDTIAAGDYVSGTADIKTAMRISKVLPKVLEKELMNADSSARRFVYYETDLNDDGKSEFLVGFTGMNWCGSGGCTALLLSQEGELITHFTVADFPFIILDQKTMGWKNLVVYSGGSDRLLAWNGKGYPGNPSIAPKFKRKLSDNFPRALEFATKPYPWFAF